MEIAKFLRSVILCSLHNSIFPAAIECSYRTGFPYMSIYIVLDTIVFQHKNEAILTYVKKIAD